MRKILAAVDNSPLAYEIMNRAVELASLTHSELTLLSVINENPLLKTSIMEEQDKLKRLHQDLVYRHFPKETVKTETSPDQHVTYHSLSPTGELVIRSRIDNGNPVEIICSYGDQIEAELIIVGSRGLGEMGALIGSISEKIVRKSSRSVLVVKTEQFDHAELDGHHAHRKAHGSKA